MPDLSGLLARCREAIGPSRELDEALAVVFGVEPIARRNVYRRGHYPLQLIRVKSIWPAYTASIDAALTLVAAHPPQVVRWADILREALTALSRRHDWHMAFSKPEHLADLPREILIAYLRALVIEEQELTALSAKE